MTLIVCHEKKLELFLFECLPFFIPSDFKIISRTANHNYRFLFNSKTANSRQRIRKRVLSNGPGSAFSIQCEYVQCFTV